MTRYRNPYKHHAPTKKPSPDVSPIRGANPDSSLRPTLAVNKPAPSYWASLLLIIFCLALASARGK